MTEGMPIVRMISDEEAQGGTRELFEKMRTSTGSVPKWMRVMGNCEDILLGFFSLFKATMDDTPLPRLLKWKVAYAVSEINKCEFCVSVSVMQLKTLGLSEDDISKIADSLDEREQVATNFAVATAKCAYQMPPETVSEAKKHFSDEELVELTAVASLFSYINRFNDALGVFPDA